MRILILAAFAVAALAMLACGDDNSDGDGATPPPQPVTLNPSIADALSCRVPAVRANPSAGGGDLQGHELTAFPLASCNDGSPAVLYFRPYEGEANRNKWIIALTGGGSCETGQDCADRWCGVGSNFDADNMSTENAGDSVCRPMAFSSAVRITLLAITTRCRSATVPVTPGPEGDSG